MKYVKRHLSVANLISCIALFVALSSVAYAATNLANKSVKTRHIANGAVTTPKLRGGAVTTPKLRNGAVTESKLASNAVSTGKLENGAVTSPKLSLSLLAQLVKNVSYINKASGTPSGTPGTTNPQSITAECPAGKQAIGGGGRIIFGTATEVDITESIPFVAGDGKRTGWTAAAKEPGAGGKTFAVEAYAVCAEL